MLYAILLYGSEGVVEGWSAEEESSVMRRHAQVRDTLAAQGRLGPVARLAPTTSATTLRVGGKPVLIDGPFAETKEQLLGIYLVDCASLDAASEVAHGLAFDSGVLEIRPVTTFISGPAGSDWPRTNESDGSTALK